jgi:erythromycin esterase
MTHQDPQDPRVTRRALLGATLAAAPAVAAAHAIAAAPATAADPAAKGGIADWLDQTATPLAGVDPQLGADDLRPLDKLVRRAVVVGLGESAHGTADQFRLKDRLVRHLVTHHGFRTLAWEDAWGAGVAVDRYIAGGEGEAGAIVADLGFNLNNAALLDLMEWLRAYNLRRHPADRVRFLGADVVQLRDRQFSELTAHVASVAPDRVAELERHLAPLKIRDNPGRHTYWYSTLQADKQAELVASAEAVRRLTREVSPRLASPARLEAELHALSLLGFYESYTPQGLQTDIRDRYIVRILNLWRAATGHRIAYSAASAHTVAAERQRISFPPGPVLDRAMAGGRLRATYRSRYVSLGLTFDHGTITAGWHTGSPSEFVVPRPAPDFVEHELARAHLGDFLLTFERPAPLEVRRWLHSTGRLRVIGGAMYDPAHDADYYMEVPRWSHGFDALLHLDRVGASRPVS